MPTPRKQQTSLSDTPFYHCISLCVRRTFLCGTDSATQKDYSHRKQWIFERLVLLANTFAIEVFIIRQTQKRGHKVLFFVWRDFKTGDDYIMPPIPPMPPISGAAGAAS